MLQVLEKYGPTIAAAVAASLAWSHLTAWEAALHGRGSEIANAFGPVFDLATFSAGSLFAIYVLALSKGEGFLGKILGTKTFRAFHSYVSRAIVLCFFLSFWTVALMVWGSGDLTQAGPLATVSAWVGLSAWAFVAVTRVVTIFLVIVGSGGVRPVGKQASAAA